MIRTLLQVAGAAVVAVALVALSGCGGSESPPDKAPATQSGHYDGDGHDHGEEAGHFEGDGHDHGEGAAHAHPTEGPHDGHLIELGNEEYHAELLHDESTNTVTVYLLDAAGKQPVAIPQSEILLQLFQEGQFVKYPLKAIPGPAGADGAALQFHIVDAGLCDSLSHEEEISGRLQVMIDGKPYTGTVEHRSHGDHDHEGHDHARQFRNCDARGPRIPR